jgi:hypothetical protein
VDIATVSDQPDPGHLGALVEPEHDSVAAGDPPSPEEIESHRPESPTY